MANGHDPPNIFCATAEDVVVEFTKRLHRQIAQAEKKAAATQKPVTITFGLAEGDNAEGRKLCTMTYLCEPGKPARRIG
jgi:hypothetical protein